MFLNLTKIFLDFKQNFQEGIQKLDFSAKYYFLV
jgi:hypothetical protein